MKKSFVLVVFLIVWNSVAAQIPNPSFELWTGNQPTSWKSYTNPPATPYTCETQTTSAYTGSLAVKSSVIYPGTPTLSLESGITTGSLSTNYYIPIFTKPTQLFGHYILNCWNDTFAVRIWVKSGGSIIGSGKFTTKTNTSVYSQFTVNITYSSVAVPDSFRIDISFNQPGPSTLPGSSYGEYFIVDDLYFDINVGLDKYAFNEFSSVKCYPNPASNKIFFDTPKGMKSKVEIFNSIGQLMISELNYETENSIDIKHLGDGIYYYMVSGLNQAYSGKLIKK